jgi:hypothetical protein
MIGDAAARGKRSSTLKPGPEFKDKKSEGRGFKTIQGPKRHNSGGGPEKHATAARMHKQMKPFSPGVADRQAPHKQKAFKESEHNEPGDILDQWCCGKRSKYK